VCSALLGWQAGLCLRARADGPEAATPPAPQKAPEAEADKEPTFKFTWQDGLVGQTSDKEFRFHVGGRIDFDSGWYRAPAALQATLDNPLLPGSDFRRFRLGVDGSAWEQFDFKLEADFSRASDFKGFHTTPQTEIFITDAWVALPDLPLVGTLRIGHQKEYLTFSNASSAKYQTFMERPLLFDAYENDFSWDNGVSLSRTYLDKSVTSWVGVFWNDTRSQAFTVDSGSAVSGRLTWLPVYDEDEQRWAYVGVSGSARSLAHDPEVVTVRPQVRTGESFEVPNLINTGAILGRNGLFLFGAGAFAADGPLTAGVEYLCRYTPNAYTGGLPFPNGALAPGAEAVGDLFFDGVSVEVLCFLTPGDHRPINRDTPGFDRVRPVRRFVLLGGDREGVSRGPGAWEVGVRYDHVNVNSGLIQAGRLDSLTFGVNWFLNPNARITANYVRTWREVQAPGGTGAFDALGVRLHLDF
jgi:phosphate-selective porin OprO/OprP